MARVMDREIVGIHSKNNTHYCLKCVPEDLFREVTLDGLITRGELERDGALYICAICKKPITAQPS